MKNNEIALLNWLAENQKFTKRQCALRLNMVSNKHALCCAHTGPDHHWSVVNAV